jgi:hypothetical protein
MKIMLEIPDYNPNLGLEYRWEMGFEIEVKYENGIIILTANKAGLFSLANHFLNLAQDKISSGYHLHLDESNSLEEGSIDLIIQKK